MIGEDADFSSGPADAERGMISHVFFHKATLESYPLLNEIDWPSLLLKLDSVSASTHRKKLLIHELASKLTKQQREAVVSDISARIKANQCRMADRSAALYLILLSTFAQGIEPNVARTLIASLTLKTAKRIRCHSPKITVPVLNDKLDTSSLKSLHFAPAEELASPVLVAAFSKWIAEVKGCPDDVKEGITFLGAFFSANGAEPAFVAMIDRLSKRNAPLAAFLLADIALALPTRFNTLLPTIAGLLASDNSEVQENMLAVAGTIALDSAEAIAGVLRSPSVKTRENAARFLVKLLRRNRNLACPELAQSLAKELSNETLLPALVEFCALAHQNELATFLDAAFKPSVKLSSRAAVMLGLLRADALHLIAPSALLNAALLKESQTAPQPQMHILLIGAFAAVLARNELSPTDQSVLKEWTLSLTKPSGCALFCDKGWAKMDAESVELWLNKAVVPMLSAQVGELREAAAASLAWFTVHGSIRRFLRAFKTPNPNAADSVCDQLIRLLNGGEFDPKPVWLLLEKLCSSDALKSNKFALAAHNERLLTSGIQSWSSLVRKHCQVDEFIPAVFDAFIPANVFDTRHAAECRLLESMLVLAPGLLSGKLDLTKMIRDITADFVERSPLSPHELAFLRGEPTPQPKPPAANKKPEPAVPQIDKETLNARIKHAKFALACCVATARALPYSSNFATARPEIVHHLARLALRVPELIVHLPDLLHALYTVSAECLNGHGPLLVSGMLRSIGAVPNWNWNIPDWESMTDSCVRISKFSTREEFSIVALAATQLLPTCKPSLALALLSLLAKLVEDFDEQSMFVDCSVVESLVPQLIAVCSEDAKLNSQATILLIAMLSWESSILSEKLLSELGRHLRSGSVHLRITILKSLISWTTAHETAALPSDLVKTCWLLSHPAHGEESESLDAMEGPESVAVDTMQSLEEISELASELLGVLSAGFLASTSDEKMLVELLSDLAAMDTESGTVLNPKSMLPFYISSISSLVKSDRTVDQIIGEFNRLLEIRTVPTAILRGKNIDRQALDFTKESRKSLLRVLGIADLGGHLLKIARFAFATGFTDPYEPNCDCLFSLLARLIDSPSVSLAEKTELYGYLQEQLKSKLSSRAQVYAVVLLGKASTSQPLSASELWALVEKLFALLEENSEDVLQAVSSSLVPLLAGFRTESVFDAAFSTFVRRLNESPSGRGIGHALGAMLQVSGSSLIRRHALVPLWKTNLGKLSQKGSDVCIIATLASIELAAKGMHEAYEPYALPLIPAVLEALGDSRIQVRQAAELCADALQTSLSPLATSLILPPLLDFVSADVTSPKYSWRGKLGAVGWLASMARASSASSISLAAALPQIVPALIVALSDANEHVHLAAHSALTTAYASIIRSPEIRAALPGILRAVCDPPKHAANCLGDIIGTSFGHAVDGPSLALLVPLLTRVLQERGTGHMTEAKRRAIVIISNLGSLMDPAELSPYLGLILPAVRGVLGDAAPSVRSGAARALGRLTRMYYACSVKVAVPQPLAELLPLLFETVFAPNSSALTPIDRAGAAQAAAQVCSAHGLDYLAELINSDPRVQESVFAPVPLKARNPAREAFLHFLATLPAALGSKDLLAPLYARILTSTRLWTIFTATADDDDGIREVATKTIRTLLLRQALLVDVDSALELILRACGDGRWRIRLSGFNILTDLLPALCSEDTATRRGPGDRILSIEMRLRTLARLFLGRFDGNSHIRNTAFSLWKSIVTHPPRVVLEILPVLADYLVAAFSSEGLSETEHESAITERFDTASAALADVLTKLADRVLVPFAHRLADLFATHSSRRDIAQCRGILAAGLILLRGAIQPALAPSLVPLSSASSGPVLAVHVSKSQAEEALRLIEKCLFEALSCIDDDSVVLAAVNLFDRIALLLPVHRDALIRRLFDSESHSSALIAILARKPRFLLQSLVSRLQAITVLDAVEFEWWAATLAAAGPHLAQHVPLLLNHLYRLKAFQGSSASAAVPLLATLLDAISTFHPETAYASTGERSYGSSLSIALSDDNDEVALQPELEDQVETALFSFGQFLETLWSAQDDRMSCVTLIGLYFGVRRETVAVFGAHRFYDTWIDRMLVAMAEDCEGSLAKATASSLEAIIRAAQTLDDSPEIVAQFTATLSNRSSVRKDLHFREHASLLSALCKHTLIPLLTDSDLDPEVRLAAAQLLVDVMSLAVADSSSALPMPTVLIASVLGAVIRSLSEQRAAAERFKAALVAIPVLLLTSIPASVKPFHPQLARLSVGLLKDLPRSGAASTFDPEHTRGIVAELSIKLTSQLLVRMSRPETLLSELESFVCINREEDTDSDAVMFEEESVYVARKLLLKVLCASVSEAETKELLPIAPSVLALIDSTVRVLLGIAPDAHATELIKAAGALGAAALKHFDRNDPAVESLASLLQARL